MLKQILRRDLLARNASCLKRTFLSDAYQCREAWQARLSTPILRTVNLEPLYYELEQKFQQKNKVSPLDIDIYANKLEDDTHIDEVADLLYKFRLTEEASNSLESTQHAVIRNYLEHGHYAQLIEILNNRIGYGVFLDTFTANLALNQLIKAKEFRYAARIATLIALQEDFSDPITSSMSLYACYRFTKTSVFDDHFDDLVSSTPQEIIDGKKKKEEIKVRVKFIRNEYDDYHFDMKDSQALLGKTFFLLGLSSGGVNTAIGANCQILGLVLLKKFKEGLAFVQANKGKQLYNEILKLMNITLEKEQHREDEDFVKLEKSLHEIKSSWKIDDTDLEQLLLEHVQKCVAEHEKRSIDEQHKTYAEWCKVRQQCLDDERRRFERTKRLEEIERLSEEMQKEEQKLWFFENEDQTDLKIDSKQVSYPKRWFGKKKKPRVVDEGYIPPEVRQRQG